MEIGKNGHIPWRSPDAIRSEMLVVLSCADTILFNDIFEGVLAAMKSKGISTGGEEILRLRIYEKLQTLVSQGALQKKGKEYKVLGKLSSIRDEEEEKGSITPRGFL